MKQAAIWKFEAPFDDKFLLQIPKGSEILSVQQDQKTMIPCIWVLVYPENEKEERFFELFKTGHPIHNDIGINRKFVGTFQIESGSLVFHLFERL
jgi:hypothetical protein